MPLLRPAVISRRSTPSFSIAPVKPKPFGDHADRPDDARLVDEDAIGGRRRVVAAGRAQLLDDDVERLVGIGAAQAPDLVVDHPGLDRAAAGTVDPQDDADRRAVLERGLERFVDLLGRRVAVGVDHAAQADDAGVSRRRGRPCRRSCRRPQTGDQQREQQQPDEAEEDPPAPRVALLAQRREHQPLEHVAFPAGRIACRRRRRGRRSVAGGRNGGRRIDADVGHDAELVLRSGSRRPSRRPLRVARRDRRRARRV